MTGRRAVAAVRSRPCAARKPAPPPSPEAEDATLLARLPTEAEIAAEVRRRPIGAVIGEICADFGITSQAVAPELWRERDWILIDCGGCHGPTILKLLTQFHGITGGVTTVREVRPPEPVVEALSLELACTCTGPP